MPNPTVTAITERFEGVAADVLEDMILELEQKNHVKVKDLEVTLIPDQGSEVPPAVEVTVTLEP
ncbi:MAG: hypothetical protein JWP43_2221 [Ramlibacter sp.]|jgi:hypothetical protein|nr:hypothetical protein [Ramlibacter sp.]